MTVGFPNFGPGSRLEHTFHTPKNSRTAALAEQRVRTKNDSQNPYHNTAVNQVKNPLSRFSKVEKELFEFANQLLNLETNAQKNRNRKQTLSQLVLMKIHIAQIESQHSDETHLGCLRLCRNIPSLRGRKIQIHHKSRYLRSAIRRVSTM